MNYTLAYAIGFHPWEDLAAHPPFAGKLLELVAREEAGREPPYGPALDLGTRDARSGRNGGASWHVIGSRAGPAIVDKQHCQPVLLPVVQPARLRGVFKTPPSAQGRTGSEIPRLVLDAEGIR